MHDISEDLGSRADHLVLAIERLSAATTLAEIAEVVRATARRIAGSDGITFVLREGDRCYYVEEDAIGPLWKGQRFAMSACISGWCMLNGETVVVPDIYKDARIPHEAYRPTFVKSLIMVPVRTPNPLAAIGAYWSTLDPVSPASVALLESLARSAAAAIAALNLGVSLSESEARLAVALRAGGLGSWELDLQTKAFDASALCKQNFGRDPNLDFTYDELIASIHPDDRERQHRAVEDALATGNAFDIEYRTRSPDGNEHWVEVRGRVVQDGSGAHARMAGVSLNVTERRRREAHYLLLMREAAHRSRNLLAVVQAMASQSASMTSAAGDFVSGFRDRLSALSSSLDLLVSEDWRGSAVDDLVRSQLAGLDDLVGSRIKLSGPRLYVSPLSAQYLGMAFHELRTNALKYGALSTNDGEIIVRWDVSSDVFTITWSESGGPEVAEPTRRGFGSQVIERFAAEAMGGSARLLFDRQGLIWELEAERAQALLH